MSDQPVSDCIDAARAFIAVRMAEADELHSCLRAALVGWRNGARLVVVGGDKLKRRWSSAETSPLR